MTQLEIKQPAFSITKPYRGFTCIAYYLVAPPEGEGQALIQIFKDLHPYRRFLYPAYKVWNIRAHFEGIVDGEIEGNMSGYDLAGWSGFHVIYPTEVPE